jgi:Carboxypeptidase regulatory-like domain
MLLMRAACRFLLVLVPTLTILLSSWGRALWAQQAQGSITGVVTDASGLNVPGAKVTALDNQTGFSRSAETLKDGSYTIPLLPPGNYQLKFEKPGFQTSVRGPLQLRVNQHAEVDTQLKVGAATTTVNVEATLPVVDTQTSSVGTTIERQKVTQLPLNGRNFLELTLFTPGVVPGTSGSENSSRGGAINVNGLRESMNSFLLDGITNTSIGVGTYVVTPPVDSVQEFRMETGVYDARFGANAGAQVNVVTKSGTNQFHGSLYEFLRNADLDARNFFEPAVPPFVRNQFGGTVGGPVILPGYNGRDKTFFFLAYEGLRERRDFLNRVRVPTLQENGGDFSGDLAPDCSVKTLLLDPLVLSGIPGLPVTVPGNNLNSLLPYIPTGTLDPLGQAFAGLYPAPNVAGAPCGGVNYEALVKRKINLDSFVTRVDHRWGTKDSIFFRYNLTNDHEVDPSNSQIFFSDLPGYGQFALNGFQLAGMDWTHAFSGSFINEAKVGYNRWQQNLAAQDQGNPFSAEHGIQGLATGVRNTGVPQLTIAGYGPIGSIGTRPQSGAVNTFQFADTLTQIHGSHALAYGSDIRTIKRGNFAEAITIRGLYQFTGVATGDAVLGQLPQLVQQQLLQACPPPSCTFGNGLADDLLGLPQDFVHSGESYISGTGTEYDFFATDNWKARRNLTLNLGLRYEYNSLVTEKYNHFSNFDFNGTCPAIDGVLPATPGRLLAAGNSNATAECFVPAPIQPVSGFVPVGTVAFGNGSENRALQYPDRNNFAPRVGLAWQPWSDGKTVIRSGYGVFYDQAFGDVYFQRNQNPPFISINLGTLAGALPAILNGTFPLGSGKLIQHAFVSASAPAFPLVRPFQTNWDDSTIQEWTFDIQRQLGDAWLLDIGYVGTRGLHLPRRVDPNQPINLSVDNSLAIEQECLTSGCPRPYPLFAQMSYAEASGSSIYHGLQLKVDRHFAKGLALLAAYTYSKAIDTNSTFLSTNANANIPQNSRDLAAEKGLSDFDHRHRLSFAYNYELPFGSTVWRTGNHSVNYAISGWQLSGIVTAQSGSVFTPIISGNISGASEEPGDTTDRPNLVGNPIPAQQTPNQWISVAAFAPPASLRFGNAGRNILVGPGLFSWDFAMLRDFRLTEPKALEFRFEMFNLTNRPNFDFPENDLASPSFGQIFNTVQPLAGLASGGPGDPREIQLGLKFLW